MSYTFDYDSLIRNLKVYSSLESADKIVITGTDISIEGSYIPAITRLISGQGSNLTIKYTEAIFSEAKRHLKELILTLDSTDDNIINNFNELIVSIMAALTGISALKRTYSGNRTIESHLQRIETNTLTEINTVVRNLIIRGYSQR